MPVRIAIRNFEGAVENGREYVMFGEGDAESVVELLQAAGFALSQDAGRYELLAAQRKARMEMARD